MDHHSCHILGQFCVGWKAISPNRQCWDSWPNNTKIIHISDGKILQKVHFGFGHYIAFNKYDIVSVRRNMFYFILVTRHLWFRLFWQSWDLQIVIYQICESSNVICHDVFLRPKKKKKPGRLVQSLKSLPYKCVGVGSDISIPAKAECSSVYLKTTC